VSRDAVIVAAVRTPVGKRNGGLAGVHPVDLSARVLTALVERAVLLTRMIHHMRDNGILYGLQTMCEGGGTANATVVELVA
jgi:acetyl-CoA acetyltransferase